MSDGEDDVVEVRHPRATYRLFGHDDAEQRLLEAYRGGRIPHAWLIGGPPGIGKATLAYRMARFVLAHPNPTSRDVQDSRSLDVPADHLVARQIAAQAHPDLLVLQRTIGDNGKLRQTIQVEDVRRSVSFFGSTAGEGGWRVAIVDSFDELNRQGENALLRILEEPPARSLLLLIGHAPGRISPTIRSRCRRLLLRPLATEDVIRAAAAALGTKPDDADIRAAAAAADGSVARALSLLDEGTLKLRQRVSDLLAQLPDLDQRALHTLGDALAKADQRTMAGVIDAVNVWLSRELGDGRGDRQRLARLAEAFAEINRSARDALTYNLECKPLILRTFGRLAEVARG
jgi:DNA polymerase-3 subunit delta'